MTTTSRRQFLKLGGTALAMIPILAVSGNASAAQNAAMRASLKYQPKPGPDGKDCSACLQVTAAGAAGTCKLMAGDTEISPKGYCVAWVKKA